MRMRGTDVLGGASNLKLPQTKAATNCGRLKRGILEVLSDGMQLVAAMTAGIKCALFAVVLLLSASVSQGFIVLWWSVGGDNTIKDGDKTYTAQNYVSQHEETQGETIGAARIRITGDGVNMVLPLYVDDGEGGWELYGDGKYTDEVTRVGDNWRDVDWAAAHVDGNTDQYTYVIELGSTETVDGVTSWKNTLAQSDPASYSDLGSYISTGGVSAQPQLPWSPGAFHAVPEPSVAMLLLFGLELLAFRRGRRKAAR